MYSYKNFKFWNKTKLWRLREDIVLNSLYITDYYNHFGIDPHRVCDFFNGYTEHLVELLSFCGIDTTKDYALDYLIMVDEPENLWEYFLCFNVCPFADC